MEDLAHILLSLPIEVNNVSVGNNAGSLGATYLPSSQHLKYFSVFVGLLMMLPCGNPGACLPSGH